MEQKRNSRQIQAGETFQKCPRRYEKLFKHSKCPWRCDNLLKPSGSLGSPISNSGLRISACTHIHTHMRIQTSQSRKWDEAPRPLQWLTRPCGDDDRLKFVAMFQRIRVLLVCHRQLSVIYFVCNCHWFMSTVLSFLSAILILSAIFSDFVQRLPVSLYLLQVIVSSGSKTTRKQQNFFRTLQNKGSRCEPSMRRV